MQIPPGSPSCLQPSRDVNAVAEEVVALNYDVADVDADAEPHLLADRSISILFRNGILSFDGTLHGIDRAGEVSDEAIASRVEDPTPGARRSGDR
jgi:hypothetical protein